MATVISKEELVTFMLMNIAEQLGRLPTSINTMTSLALQDVDSLALGELGIALTDFLGKEIAPDLFWEYITIDTAAGYLAGQESLSGKDN